uniref:PIH1 N-terminal domain-containing protein n=1 Tax=Peronospora matthiolae TaxID=2874970 RepID=A0AAV1U4V2_9STRA
MEDEAALAERYADWLNELEQTNPEGYQHAIATLQSQLQSAGSGLNDGPGIPKEFKPRFPGDKIMEEKGLKATAEGVYVDVKAGFTIKTRDVKNREKVFVNVVFTDEIQEFSEKRKLDNEGKEHVGIHVPLSLGAPHEVKDKMGATSVAFDVAVNTKVVEDCKADKTGAFYRFVCELAIKYIDQKYKVKLDHCDEKQQLAYQGALPPPKHYIRKKQAPIIEIVTTDASKKVRTSKPAARKVSSFSKTATASYEIFEDREDERTVCQRSPAVMKGSTPLSPEILLQAGDRLIVSIQFKNEVHATTDVEVELQAELLTIKAATHRDLEIFLPYPVEVNLPTICFDQVRNKMDITLLIDKSWNTLGPDCGSAPWLLARELAEHNDSQVSGNDNSASGKPETLAEMFLLANTNLLNDGSAPTKKAGRRWDPVMDDNGQLPEDQFHRKDALSMHILEQQRMEREQKENKVVAQKRTKAEEVHLETHGVEKLYPNEPEITYLDVEDIVRQEEARLDRHIQQQQEADDHENDDMSAENAERVAAKWSGNNSTLNLQSALAFDLL